MIAAVSGIKQGNMGRVANNIARRLAATKMGQNALAEPADLSQLKGHPSPRLYLGLLLIATSYLLGIPGMALVAWLSNQQNEPWMLLYGGGAVFVGVHLIFCVGVWLAGANYARVIFQWALGRFLVRH